MLTPMPSNDALEIPTPAKAAAAGSEVTPLELFFDLVFVFTITQLTTLLAREPTWSGLGQVALLFGNVWWMYGGYAWLTNAVPPRELGVRLLLLVGMGGFLIVALSIPTAYHGGGLAFGIGYLIVTLVHTGLFLRVSEASVFKSIVSLGPFNLITAGMLLAGGASGPTARVALFAAAFVVHWVSPFITRTSGFRIRGAHFVERHGLIVLIAIGESVVAVGIGLGTIALPAGRILTALLGLALAAGLWWLYFSGEERRAELAFEKAGLPQKPWIALNAFGYGFLPLLGGIVAVAAGTKLAVVRYNEPSTISAAVLLAGGIFAYLIGLVLFRVFVGSGRLAVRLLIALLALPTAFIGILLDPLAQLAALSVLLILGIGLDSRFD
jgi:low temperature requirement protein LtrA